MDGYEFVVDTTPEMSLIDDDYVRLYNLEVDESTVPHKLTINTIPTDSSVSVIGPKGAVRSYKIIKW